MNRRAWIRGAVASAALGLLLMVATSVRAQEVNLATLDEPSSANRVYVRTGAEYGFVASVGYARAVALLGRRLLLGGELTAPWAGVDASDYRLRAGALIPIVGTGRWKLAGAVAPTLRATRNDLGRMTSLGGDLGLAGGYYARHWFVASEIGFDWAMTTHVSHSELYRATVYAEAREGWYSNPGGNFRYGVQGGGSLGRHDLVLRIGQVRDTGGDPPLLPFYGTLTFNTRW